MVEHVEVRGNEPCRPRSDAWDQRTFAGTDILPQTVLRSGHVLMSRDTGVLAAIGAGR
jgi:hypothetical protein